MAEASKKYGDSKRRSGSLSLFPSGPLSLFPADRQGLSEAQINAWATVPSFQRNRTNMTNAERVMGKGKSANKKNGGYAKGYQPDPVKAKPKKKKDNNGGYAEGWRPDPVTPVIVPEDVWDYSFPGGEMGMTLEDALSQARGIVGDGGLKEALSIIAGREAAARKNFSESDSRLNSMYDFLAKSIAADQGAIDKNAADARATTDKISSTEAAGAKASYDATQAAQAERRSRLGIEDAEIYDAGTGNLQDQVYRNSANDAGQRGSVMNDYITKQEMTNEALNQANVTAARTSGVNRRSDLNRELTSYLGQLQDEQANARMQIGQQNQDRSLQLAQQLLGNARSQYDSQYTRWMDSQRLQREDANTAWEQGMAEEQMRNQMREAAQAGRAPSGPSIEDQLKSSPEMQYQYNIGSIAGPQQAARANDILAANTTFVGGKMGINYNAAMNALTKAGFKPAQATQFISMYQRSLG